MKQLHACIIAWIAVVASTLTIHAATVKTIAIPSKAMSKEIPAIVILPEAYKQEGQRLPVLYLLHGAGGNYTSWARGTTIEQLADQYGIIVLCPDGGVTSWYLDSPVDPSYQYETFVAKECVAYLDEHYRTKPNRNSRATCGFSMGGHGALYLAIRHPETFGIASSISGGVDIRPFPRNWDLPKRLGNQKSHPENWETHTVANLAKKLKDENLAISFECGTDDFFLKVNRALHQQFLDSGITHIYAEHPGAHNGAYRAAAIQRQMPFIAKQFTRAKGSE